MNKVYCCYEKVQCQQWLLLEGPEKVQSQHCYEKAQRRSKANTDCYEKAQKKSKANTDYSEKAQSTDCFEVQSQHWPLWGAEPTLTTLRCRANTDYFEKVQSLNGLREVGVCCSVPCHNVMPLSCTLNSLCLLILIHTALFFCVCVCVCACVCVYLLFIFAVIGVATVNMSKFSNSWR